MTARRWLVVPAMAGLAAALLPPVRTLADGFLFSADMLQHLLLQLVVPPLILLSLPESGVESENLTGRSALAAWLAGVGAMWICHEPLLCNAVLLHPALRLFQYATLLLLGSIFWLPIVSPKREWRLPPLLGMFYLFTACLSCTILGIVITFAPPSLYGGFFHSSALPPLLSQWEMTPADDQRAGGLLMWVPACLVYMTGILGLLFRWYGTGQDELTVAHNKV